MARNNQLVRQWKILRGLAECKLEGRALEISKILCVCRRTAARDLQALADAGFLAATRKHTGGGKRKTKVSSYWRIRDGEEQLVEKMRQMIHGELADVDAGRCACGHEYELNGRGVVSSRDVELHRRRCKL